MTIHEFATRLADSTDNKLIDAVAELSLEENAGAVLSGEQPPEAWQQW